MIKMLQDINNNTTMLCVEIPAKQGMPIFWLDEHLVYGLSQIATVLAPAQSISQCISVRAPGASPALTVPAWPSHWGSAPACPTPSWGGGMASGSQALPQWTPMGSPAATVPQRALRHLLCKESNTDASIEAKDGFSFLLYMETAFARKPSRKD